MIRLIISLPEIPCSVLFAIEYQMEVSTPALFLDRDGVIIENRPNYIRSWSDVEIYPQALTALAKIRNSPYKIVIITNQSAVGRGLMTIERANKINRKLVAEVEKMGGRIDGVYMCPHGPDEGCPCRKPQPGLLFRAADDQNLDLVRSIMIGDAISDIVAAASAGLSNLILVQTGRGTIQANLPEVQELPDFLVYKNLAEAIDNLQDII